MSDRPGNNHVWSILDNDWITLEEWRELNPRKSQETPSEVEGFPDHYVEIRFPVAADLADKWFESIVSEMESNLFDGLVKDVDLGMCAKTGGMFTVLTATMTVIECKSPPVAMGRAIQYLGCLLHSVGARNDLPLDIRYLTASVPLD